jgi:hypothetical protein
MGVVADSSRNPLSTRSVPRATGLIVRGSPARFGAPILGAVGSGPGRGGATQVNRIPGQGFFCALDGASKRRMQNPGRPMPSHKFKIGDVVNLKPSISRNVPGGTSK